MAVERSWIKNALIAFCVSLLLLTITQLGLAVAFSFYLPTAILTSSIDTVYILAAAYVGGLELISAALFLMPAIWLGFAAAASRHRGVYIMATVLCCLALLDAIGFIIYESWVFAVTGIFQNTSGVQAITVTKLVVWSLTLLFLVAYVSVVIAGDCSRKSRPKYRAGNYYQGPMMAYPDEYQLREYQPKYLTATPPTPARYFDYGNPSPKHYYK